jgi:hypothetical protein
MRQSWRCRPARRKCAHPVQADERGISARHGARDKARQQEPQGMGVERKGDAHKDAREAGAALRRRLRRLGRERRHAQHGGELRVGFGLGRCLGLSLGILALRSARATTSSPAAERRAASGAGLVARVNVRERTAGRACARRSQRA